MSKYLKSQEKILKEILFNNEGTYGKRENGDLDLNHIKEQFEESNLILARLYNTKLKSLENLNYTYISNWHSGDNLNLFNTNISDPNMKSLMKKIGWIDENEQPKKIDYFMNKQGFRCKDFDKIQKPGILFAGCSQTFGVGMPIEHTFSQLVSDRFDCENINLGSPGRGLDYLSYYLDLFLEDVLNFDMIKAIAVYLPPAGRISYFLKDNRYKKVVLDTYHNDPVLFSDYYNVNGIKDIDITKTFEFNKMEPYSDKWWEYIQYFRSNMYENYMIQKENTFLRDLININSFKLLANRLNVPLVVLNQKVELLDYNENEPFTMDFGRDMMHLGRGKHRYTAKRFIKELEQFLDK